jgi:hypothetical protein
VTNLPTNQKTFILGLGAQKAGTSWLHDYLATSGLVAMQKIKEYHIWDALHIPGVENLGVSAADSDSSFANRVRYFMQQSPDNYFGYFAYMMSQQNRHITCDITPLYSGLDRQVLSMINEGFSRHNIRTKAVFLMRDPIERCWSSARMESRNEHGHTRVDDDDVLRWAQTRLNVLRARYDVTVGEIEAVFPAHNTHFGIYEDMFNPDRLSELSEFCGVPFRPLNTERKLNVSEKAAPLSDAACERIARHYRDVYRFAELRFPQTTALWRGFRYL